MSYLPTNNNGAGDDNGLGNRRKVMILHEQRQFEDRDLPINFKLRQIRNRERFKLKPRRYQLELFHHALKQNTIIYLGTGLGKTFIIVQYLQDAQVQRLVSEGKRVVFLAPTQDLIKQQAEYLTKQLDYSGKVYSGRSSRAGEHIDHWNFDTWQDELKKIEVLFMTPQIFASAVQTNLLDWSHFCAVIFDEIHHACRSKKKKDSKHPYGQILASYNIFYKSRPDADRPRLIGLTASLLNNMPKDRETIREEVRHIEALVHGRCVTDITAQDIRPMMVIHQFTSLDLHKLNDALSRIFYDLQEKMTAALKTKELKKLFDYKPHNLSEAEKNMLTFYNRLKLASTGISIKPASFPKVIDALKIVRARCGLWALRAICDKLIEPIRKHGLNPCVSVDIAPLYEHFAVLLTKIRDAINQYIGSSDILAATRPKLHALLDALKCEHQRSLKEGRGVQFSCIVFVKSRLEVVALTNWLQKVSCTDEYSFIKSDYAVGLAATMASKYACITKRKAAEQNKMLEAFRSGYLNVIITTSVLEEGIDLPSCSTVIRYDESRNFREFVQSRGRARQRDSSYITLAERSASDDTHRHLDIFDDFERTVKEALSNDSYRTAATKPPAPIRDYGTEDTEDYFLAKENTVQITPSVAKTILNIYYNRLAKSTPYIDGIRYERERKGLAPNYLYRTILYLPSGCPLNGGIAGGFKTSSLNANNSAAVAAVKALYEAGELDERGCPTRVSEKNIDNLLATSGLEPTFDPIDPRLEGICEGEIEFFKPKILQLEGNLSRDSSNRLYKLIRIHYQPVDGQSRNESAKFFRSAQFGLVVDSNTNCDLLPSLLHSHYGLIAVRLELVHENLSISKTTEHNELSNFTYKLLTRVLSIRDLTKEEFRLRCQFYLVLIDGENKLNINKMRETFTGNLTEFSVGHVVKVREIFADRDTKYKLMIVQKIHHDMNADSIVPGTRMTFTEYLMRKYNRQVLTSTKQPVIELMTISRDYATIRPGKKAESSYQSRPIFMLQQFLEHFDSDAAVVMQCFNKPEIIQCLYNSISVTDLCNKFADETKIKRKEICLIKDITSVNLGVEIEPEPEDSDAQENKMQVGDNEDECHDEEGDCGVDVEEEEEDGYEYEDEEMNLSDSDESEEDDAIRVGVDYHTLLTQNVLDLNSYDDSDKMECWDLDEYQVTDLKRLPIVYRRSEPYETDLERRAKAADSFERLEDDIRIERDNIIDRLSKLEVILIGDAWLVNEDDEFKKRAAIVDHSIVSPVRFGQEAKPLRAGSSREQGFLEALTQRRAQQTYSLEGLENIGDSYLKYVVSVVLYLNLEGNEGFLTAARSRLISNQHFNYLAKKKQLGCYAISRPFNPELLAYALGRPIKCDLIDIYNRTNPKDLADLFESIVGSCLVHGGEFEAILAMEWLGLKIFKDDTFEELNEQAVVFGRAPSALGRLADDQEDKQLLDKQYRDLKAKFRKFERIIGYNFKDPSFLVQAFTHASSPTRVTRSYERLEFLGDAILDFLVTMTLAKCSPRMFDPGQMTSSRSAVVNNIAFARVAMKYKYDLFIQHFNDALYDELNNVRLTLEEDPDLNALDMVDFDSVVKLLGDVFESVAGAIYLDSGCSLDTVWSVYYPMLKDSIDGEIKEPSKNMLVMLHEAFPGRGRVTFEEFDTPYSEDEPRIGVRCTVVGVGSYEGRGLSKRQAKKRAVLEAIKNMPPFEERKRLNSEYLATHKPLRAPNSRGRGRGGRGGGGQRRGGAGRGRAGFRGRRN